SLAVGGAVERRLRFTWPELLELPEREVVADFHCVTGWSRLGNRWTGVALAELARRAGLQAGARFVRFSDGGRYGTSVPRALGLGTDVLLARLHDGLPLPIEHGGPLRAVVPRRYAWKSCKWVREVEFLRAERLGFWELRGYHNGADPWKEERLV